MHSARFYWHRLRALACFYRRARTIYDVHSPYLADLIRNTIEDERTYFTFIQLDSLRRYWAQQHTLRVPVLDQGAGSRVSRAPERTAAQLVRHSAVSPASGRFLFRLAHWARPRYLLELGTNLGLSALYLHGADRRAQLITVEGNPAIARMAEHSFRLAGAAPTLQPHVGLFHEVLPQLLPQLPRIDLFFLDGDHRGVATLDYFTRCLASAHEDSIFIIGDIHWSPDMEAAWARIQQHESVRATVDVFHFGLVFFRPEFRHKEHWTLAPWWWKPWRMGFF